MPSTFLRFAVDMEGNGRPDVVEFDSRCAGLDRQLSARAGWMPGLPWGFEVRVPAGYSTGRGAPQKASHGRLGGPWDHAGRRRAFGNWTAGLIMPAGPRGPAFLVTHNFEVLFTYNEAEAYALADLAPVRPAPRQAGLLASWPTNDPGLSRAERREMQALLIRDGYDVGDPNGAMGNITHAAILAFQARAGLASTAGPPRAFSMLCAPAARARSGKVADFSDKIMRQNKG